MNLDPSLMRSLKRPAPTSVLRHKRAPDHVSGLIGATCLVRVEDPHSLTIQQKHGIIRDRHDDGSYAVYVPSVGQTEIVEASDIIVTGLPPIVR